MDKKIFIIVLMLIAVSSLAGAAAAATISFDPSSVTLSPGSTTQITVRLSDASGGLAGYEIKLSYPTSSVAITDVAFPSWAGLNRKSTTSGGYIISGVDLNKQIESGATNVALGTITFKGVASGSATVSVSSVQMNADDGTVVTPDTSTLSMMVSGDVTASPTTSATTTTTPMITATTTTAAVTATTTIATTTAVTTAAVATSETTAAVVTVTPVIPGAPTTGFTANPVAGNVPLTVQFMDRSSASPTSFEWNFGDGGSSLSQNPTYTYRNAGIYTVSLTATNDVGSTTNTRAGFITILKPGETLPVTSTPVVSEPQTVSTTSSLPVTTSSWRPTLSKTKKAAPDPALTLLGAGIALSGIVLLQRRRIP